MQVAFSFFFCLVLKQQFVFRCKLPHLDKTNSKSFRAYIHLMQKHLNFSRFSIAMLKWGKEHDTCVSLWMHGMLTENATLASLWCIQALLIGCEKAGFWLVARGTRRGRRTWRRWVRNFGWNRSWKRSTRRRSCTVTRRTAWRRRKRAAVVPSSRRSPTPRTTPRTALHACAGTCAHAWLLLERETHVYFVPADTGDRICISSQKKKRKRKLSESEAGHVSCECEYPGRIQDFCPQAADLQNTTLILRHKIPGQPLPWIHFGEKCASWGQQGDWAPVALSSDIAWTLSLLLRCKFARARPLMFCKILARDVFFIYFTSDKYIILMFCKVHAREFWSILQCNSLKIQCLPAGTPVSCVFSGSIAQETRPWFHKSPWCAITTL